MQIARRVYLYVISGITLAVLAAGLSMLLAVLFEQLGLRSGDPFAGGNLRDRLSLAGALVGVALPVWGIHWWLVQRGASGDAVQARIERADGLRAFYLAAVMAVSVGFAAAATANLVRQAVLALSSGELFLDPSGNAALLVTAATVWSYHAWTRLADLQRVSVSRSAAWWPRLYRYAAAVIGLFVLLSGVVSLIDVALAAVAGAPSFGFDPNQPWWSYPLADALSRTLVGLALWLGHWTYSSGLLGRDDWRGASERASALRTAAYVAILLGTAIGAIASVGESAQVLMAELLGVEPVFGEPSLAANNLVAAAAAPFLAAVSFAVAWWFHRAWLGAEARRSDEPSRMDRAVRLDFGAAALVGVGFGAVAVAWLIGLLLDVLLGGSRVGSEAGGVWRAELSTYVPLAIFGLAAWAWGWSGLQSRRAADPEGEVRSTVRRAYLLLVLAGSMIALVSSLALILYRLFGALLGADLPLNLVSELSTPIGALVMAAAIASYHGLALRRDLREGTELREPVPGPPSEPSQTRLPLVLTGPADADLATLLGSLRRQLPPGYSLEIDAPPVAGDG